MSNLKEDELSDYQKREQQIANDEKVDFEKTYSRENKKVNKIIAVDEMHNGIDLKKDLYFINSERRYREWANNNPNRHDNEG